MGTDSRVLTSSPPLVALAAWLVPGSGYLLIGQRARGLVTGITIILLFMSGLLIAGVRVVEVPGYDTGTGEARMVNITASAYDRNGNQVNVPVMVSVVDPKTGEMRKEPLRRWSMAAAPLNEIRDKPWSVPQALAGPIAVAAGAASVYAAGDGGTGSMQQLGALTHARINELGSLYLSVAGLLNLMIIIDSTWRASHITPSPVEESA